ncbi:MAG: cation diffusion facilitator family transporter [Microcystaceae cyanobacterium]
MEPHHHDHHHDHHGHHHHHSPSNPNRAFIIGLVLNIFIVVIQVIFGFVSHSLSLLADAGHNLGDVLGLLIAWTASWLVKRQASARYTYGFRRSSILAALLNASLIMIALGAIAVEALHRLQNPQPLQENIVIIVASLGMILNGFTAWLFSKDQQDLNLKGVFLHMVTDALVSLGVVLGAIAILITGWTWLDPLMSLVISVLIFWGTWGLLKDSVALLLDGVPVNIKTQAVQTYLQELPNVVAIHDLHIWAMSTTENALTVHVIVENSLPNDQFLQTLQQEIKEYFGINHTTIQLENGQNLLACRTQNCYHPS